MKKGRIFDIKRFAVHDGEGIRTTVFFKGCPLRCVWCHNPEGLSAAPQVAFTAHNCIGCGACAGVCPAGAQRMEEGRHRFLREYCRACGACADVCPQNALTLYGKEASAEELLPLLLEDREFYEASGGGVTLSGGECLLQADFCAELLRLLKDRGIHTAVDTCGFVPRAALEMVLPFTDVFLYDIKAVDDAVHRRCTGQPAGLIRDNLQYLWQCGAKAEIRVPFVPGWNDAQVPSIAAFLGTYTGYRRVRVLPYHNFAISKYRAVGLDPTMPEQLPTGEALAGAEALFRARGFTVCNQGG